VIRNIHLTDDEDEIEGPHRQGEGPGVVHGISEEGVRAMREIVRKHPNVVPAKAGTNTPRPMEQARWRLSSLLIEACGYGSPPSRG
jgi:hypothetical protein